MATAFTTNTLFADDSFIDKYKLIIELNNSNMTKGVYFGGDCIQGGVRIPYNSDLLATSRLDIHLSCTFQPHTVSIGRSPTIKLFKVIVSPCPLVIPNNDYVSFSIPIPANIPSTLKDKALPGQIIYKLKAVHEMEDLPLSLHPKVSMEICVLERISANSIMYKSPISNEKEFRAILPKDVTGKNKAAKWIKNDANIPVHCKLTIPTSCFLEGHSIPISVHVQHIAPVKQMHGIQIQLERITNMETSTSKTGRTVNTLVLSEIILPLICDIDDFSATANCHITVPDQTSPTLQTNMSPLQISYRIKAVIDVETSNLLDKATATLRKRDIAKDVVCSWGKRIVCTDDGSTTTGILSASIVELELPITIGTTTATMKDDRFSSSSLPSLSSESQLSCTTLSTISSASSSCPPKLPIRPASISSLPSLPDVATPSTYYQHHQLTASPISEKGNWIKTPSLPSLAGATGTTVPPQTRRITDPFSLANHNSSYAAQQQLPSAPELGDIEGISKKHARSLSIPSHGLENHALYMAN
ncbi:hypothetical protein BCR42DRAFT_419554 [Absidia repens]|uniref:Arrestin C-terminal-like domain-containing protein n=1 Tax=Absidia repens TaxID=90262 RepID=A0A1X2IBH0_9FUNG|nr:hypothetical protein BCR42DRAFT_419554 [Absidia repens]